MSDAPTFEWDKKLQRYRYTSGKKNGQFIAEKDIRQLTEDLIDQKKKNIRAIGKLLLDKNIGTGTFETAVARELKESHILAYTLGKGGFKQLNRTDWGRVGAKLRFEYEHLRSFSQDILDGKLSKKQIQSRLEMYLDSLYSTYSIGTKEGHRENGYLWEKWNDLDDGGTCSGCSDQGSRGWQALGTYPPIGSQQCLSKCRCWLDYSNDFKKPENDSIYRHLTASLTKSFGWL